jgi:hypothetical protein
MTDKPKNLRVVDQDTGTEIAELGVVRKKAIACIDCRFHGPQQTWVRPNGSTYKADECRAFQQPCATKNANADCEYFEPRAALERRDPKALALSYVTSLSVFLIIVVAVSFLLGRCVA